MDENTYNIIYDALCMADDLLDDLSNPDYDKIQNKIDKAINTLYSWYMKTEKIAG